MTSQGYNLINMVLRRIVALAVAGTAALLLTSCGGSGLGTSFGKTPGIYLVDQGSSRIVWVSDMNATFFNSFNSAVTGVTNVVNGSAGPDGHLYLIDGDASTVVRFDDLQGDGRIVVGSHGSGDHQFLNPVRVASDPQGIIYVVDAGKNQLIRITTSSWSALDISPWFASTDDPDVAVDRSGHIFLAGGTHIVRLPAFAAANAVIFGAPGTGTGQFNKLTGVCLDDQGRIYTADSVNNRIARMDNISGTGWLSFGSTGAGPGEFDGAFGVGVDHSGLVYVGDSNNHRLVRVDDMTGANWTELDSLPSGSFGLPLSVFPHLPTY